MDIIAQYLPDLFQPIVDAASATTGKTIYYDWGHKKEVAGKLVLLDQSNTKKAQKYPLIWLVMDFDEFKGTNLDVYTKTGISFVICANTNKDYTEQQRRDNVYKPILLPIYEAFMNAFGQSTIFRKPDPASIAHTFRLRPYWGEGGTNLFNDYVDCIEIANLKLDIRRLTCRPSATQL